ncbi:MAG: hypothetical protein KJO11_05360 [Gemmatimonadetes bacterium]|nr:hypothetical protein [Gemmatimonadota bacterium]MBT8403933.1 hypothetical protein [Gemmatimonadota bacterium]NNF39231.1 hypothetical protein [Gemmatimonadota bacterium]NNK62303.1 hypothetical protein [Gemmatimonadota bacterium]
MDTRQRTQWTSIAVLAVVFASGIMVGFAWDRRLDAAEAETARVSAETVVGTSESAEDESSDRSPRRTPMYEQVEPSDAQRLLIDSIVGAYRTDVRTFVDESRAQYDEGRRQLVLSAREAIKAVLDPEQAARYDSLTAARDARTRARSEQDEGDGGADSGDSRQDRD